MIFLNREGFIATYLVYMLFLILVMAMFTIMMINNYKMNFLNTLKNDIKLDLENYHLEKISMENQ